MPLIRRRRRRAPQRWISVRIARNAIEFAAALVVLIPIALVALGAAVAWISHHSLAGGLAAGTLLGVALSVVALTTVFRPALRALGRGYRWTRAEFTLVIDPDDHRRHVHDVAITLRAVRPWLTVFENRYHWTGRGDEPPPTLLKGGQALLGPIQIGIWRYYYVHFGTPLTVGEEREVEIQQQLHDDAGEFQPHMSKTILEPVRNLTLRVFLPADLWPAEIRCFEGPPVPAEPRSELPYTTDTRTGEICLHVEKPKYGCRYSINW